MMTRDISRLKVIHLSTSHTGGAGIAARRLNKILNSHDISSAFYAIDRKDYTPEEIEYVIYRSFFTRLKGLPALWLSKYLSDFSFFSLISTSAISNFRLKSLVSSDSTILHIHNWFNLLSQRQLVSLVKSGVPIVITMHDQRMMTGGCHYASNCKNFYSGCGSCPITPFILSPIPPHNSRKLLAALHFRTAKVKIVAPSMYLVNEAKKSFSLRNIDVSHVSNLIPKDFILRHKKPITPVPTHTYLVGIASMNPYDFIKGGDIIEEIISSSFPALNNIAFVKLSDFPPDAHRDFWSSIDCLLVPSRADNSPNVIHEAKEFGIPVIATDAGGIPELLSPLVDVIIPSSKLSSKTVIEGIILSKQKKLSEKDFDASHADFKNYTHGSVEKLIELYSKLIRD